MVSRHINIVDGREVPTLEVSGDYVLVGEHLAGVDLRSGHLEIRGTVKGSLSVEPGSSVTVLGKVQGSVSIPAGVRFVVQGAVEGSMSVACGAEVVVEADGKHAGSLHNDGLVIIRGVIGGARSGAGELRLEDAGYIKQPTRVEGDTSYYEW